MEDVLGAASQSVQAGTQVVKLSMDGMTLIVKGSVELITLMARLIQWLSKQTAGSKLLQMGGSLKTYRIDAKDWKEFQRRSASSGLTYVCIGNSDGAYDLVFSDRQVELINDIVRRLPSMREIRLDGEEIDNKAVVVVNDGAVKEFEKSMGKNNVYYRRESAAPGENTAVQGQVAYYIHPEALPYVKDFLENQAGKKKTKFDRNRCAAYSGREYAEKNRHVAIVTSSPEVLHEISKWAIVNQEAGDIFRMEDKNAVMIGDDDLKNFLHENPQYEPMIRVENYAEYLARSTPHPFNVDAEQQPVNRRAAEPSETQVTVREITAAEHPVTAKEWAEKTGQTEEAVKGNLDHLAELGVIKKDSAVSEDGSQTDAYGKMPGKEREIQAFLVRDAAVQERMARETISRAEAGGMNLDMETAKQHMTRVELPAYTNETKNRMEYHIKGRNGTEYEIDLRKADLVIAPNGKRYAWISSDYDYNVFNLREQRMQRISSIFEPPETKKAGEAAQSTVEHQKSDHRKSETPGSMLPVEEGASGEAEIKRSRGLDLVDAFRREAAVHPQPVNVQEAVEREEREITGKQKTNFSQYTFEETADMLSVRRAARFEKTGIENNFSGAFNHNQYAGTRSPSDTILCDRMNPGNHIRIHTENAVDPRGNAYAKNDYRVFHNMTEVSESEYGYHGKFTDERFEGRDGNYWPLLRSEMQRVSGISDDVLEFQSEEVFDGYYQKFLGSETYKMVQTEEAAEKAEREKQGQHPDRRRIAEPERVTEPGRRTEPGRTQRDSARPNKKRGEKFRNFGERPSTPEQDVELERALLRTPRGIMKPSGASEGSKDAAGGKSEKPKR